MSAQTQNVRMTLLASLLLVAITGSVYVAAYLSLGTREDATETLGTKVRVVVLRSYSSTRLAHVFVPLARLEALLLQRSVEVTGPLPGFLTNDPPKLSY